MGSTWFTFSHEIGVPDGTIDEIDNTSDNNQERIERVRGLGFIFIEFLFILYLIVTARI